jgi:excisionase family DNA binding protein
MTTAAHTRLLTVAEAALALRCSAPTIRRRIREGSLPVIQLGGAGHAIRIPRDALQPERTER